MDLVNYVNRKVKIILVNNYYYVGVVQKADEGSIDLIDFQGHNVSLTKEAISSIQEISK